MYLQTHDIEEEDPVHEEKAFQTWKPGIENLKNGLLKREKQLSYEPKDFKRFCVECNAEQAFLTLSLRRSTLVGPKYTHKWMRSCWEIKPYRGVKQLPTETIMIYPSIEAIWAVC